MGAGAGGSGSGGLSPRVRIAVQVATTLRIHCGAHLHQIPRAGDLFREGFRRSAQRISEIRGGDGEEMITLSLRTVADRDLVLHLRVLLGERGCQRSHPKAEPRFPGNRTEPVSRHSPPAVSLKQPGPWVLFLHMPMLSGAYDGLLKALRRVSPVLSHGSSKVAEGLRGRVNARGVLAEWAESHRDPGLPFIWFHAPSVGEGLQARAVLEALHGHPERRALQSAFTFFSPSAVPLARSMPVEVSSPLPWDVREEMDELLELLAPNLIAFTKTEVWPGLTAAAVRRGVPVVLMAATLSPGARRLRGPARAFLRPTFASLSRVLAISAEDGDRFSRLGVAAERIQVTGDPGVDSAQQRVRTADTRAAHLAPFFADPRPTLVAGSTWGPDEVVLVPAVERVREQSPRLRLVIAPHEPREPHLVKLEAGLRIAGMRTARLSEVEASGRVDGVDAVVVDRVGVLAELYAVGSIGFVGGGFGRDGLHSVLEPAAAGIPSLFGPAHGNSRAARELIGLGGAKCVLSREELTSALMHWVRDERWALEAGARASEYIHRHRGAAGRTAEALRGYLPPHKGTAP
jgi:3-deoxy-D-manno-octulosonic-acid transferase